MPDQQQRLLCAKLILEEALETINALGCYVTTDATGGKLEVGLDPDEPTLVLDDIIDGCCDTMVVTLGTLVACGVPDSPHMQEVLECNLAKFPGGIATVDKKTGKYLKPEGWKGPDHERVQRSVRRNIPASAPASEQ
jgi:predicted HAD superfamily Cof-like phosphohydrolase